MNPDAQMVVPISEANKDFSHVMHMADSYGSVVILKENKPKYLLIDLDQESLIYDLTEEEKMEIASKRIMRQYKPALEELVKSKQDAEPVICRFCVLFLWLLSFLQTTIKGGTGDSQAPQRLILGYPFLVKVGGDPIKKVRINRKLLSAGVLAHVLCPCNTFVVVVFVPLVVQALLKHQKLHQHTAFGSTDDTIFRFLPKLSTTAQDLQQILPQLMRGGSDTLQALD